ncbi:hypothetical protein D3C85_1196560 [compost metagenome]
MCLGAGNEQQRARGDALDVIERVKVHELHVAGQRRHGGCLRRCASRSDFASRCAIEIVELISHGVAGQFERRAAGVADFTALEFPIAPLARLANDLLALFNRYAVLEAITIGCAHVVHTDGGDCLKTRINLGRTDGEAATATDADYADTLTINNGSSTEEVHGGTEVFGVNIRRDRLTRCAFAFTPEG